MLHPLVPNDAGRLFIFSAKQDEAGIRFSARQSRSDQASIRRGPHGFAPSSGATRGRRPELSCTPLAQSALRGCFGWLISDRIAPGVAIRPARCEHRRKQANPWPRAATERAGGNVQSSFHRHPLPSPLPSREREQSAFMIRQAHHERGRAVTAARCRTAPVNTRRLPAVRSACRCHRTGARAWPIHRPAAGRSRSVRRGCGIRAD